MIEVLARALSSQILLILVGLSTLQLLRGRTRIRWMPLLPYAWGVGVVVLYVLGQALVRTLRVGPWHLVAAALMVAVIAAGVWRFGRAARAPDRRSPSAPWRWYEAVLLVLLAARIGIVAYLNGHDPIIDSDATLASGYAPLARKLGEGLSAREALADAGGQAVSPWGPPILLAWVRMFLDRWHDSVAGLPWLFAYLSTIGVAFTTCRRVTGHRSLALACAWVIASLPLTAMHTFRIGYNDLLTAYFVTLGLAVLTRAVLEPGRVGRTWLGLGVVALLGSAMSKMEGGVWALCMAVAGLGYFLRRVRGVRWRRILTLQAAVALVLLASYAWGAGEWLARALGGRASYLAPHALDPRALAMTFGFLFGWGSFNILWWLGPVIALSLLVWDAPGDAKALVVYAGAMVAGVVLVANVTGSVEFTVNGTNVGRFLLQVTGVLVPLVCAYARQFRVADGRP
ncbi:MAG: hypothetical protein ACRENJ_06080 [Candidatus Eiseniibacteriota bacterium]